MTKQEILELIQEHLVKNGTKGQAYSYEEALQLARDLKLEQPIFIRAKNNHTGKTDHWIIVS